MTTETNQHPPLTPTTRQQPYKFGYFNELERQSCFRHKYESLRNVHVYKLSPRLLFVFLISSILHHHPALLHHHTLILDHLLTCLVAFSTLVLKPSFSQSLSLHSHLSLPQADLLEFDHSLFDMAVVVLVSAAD